MFKSAIFLLLLTTSLFALEITPLVGEFDGLRDKKEELNISIVQIPGELFQLSTGEHFFEEGIEYIAGDFQMKVYKKEQRFGTRYPLYVITHHNRVFEQDFLGKDLLVTVDNDVKIIFGINKEDKLFVREVKKVGILPIWKPQLEILTLESI